VAAVSEEKPELQRALNEFVSRTYLPDSQLPYHGQSHPHEILRHAATLTERAKKYGITVDELALQRAALLHDLLGHLNPKFFGFSTSESFSGSVALNFLLSQGCSESEAKKVQQIIHASNPFIEPVSIEDKILRAADLWNLGSPYENFKSSTLKYHRELELQRGSLIQIHDYLRESYAYLRFFVWRALDITAESRDSHGRSTWHMSMLENLLRFHSEVLGGNSSRIVAEVCPERSAPTVLALGRNDFYLCLAESEEQRQTIVTHLTKSKHPFAFAIPGSEQGISLPDSSCDELILHSFTISALKEAARVLKENGELRIHCPPNINREAVKFAALKNGFSRSLEEQNSGAVTFSFRKSPGKDLSARTEEGEPIDSLRGWARALEDLSTPEFSLALIQNLRRPMHKRYELLKEMGLLRIPVVSVSADTFLSNPGEYLDSISGKKLFPFVEPTSYHPERPRLHNTVADRELLPDLVRATVSGYDPKDFMVTLQPALPVLFNGNITVKSQGDVFAEFSGSRDIPSRQGARILFSAWRSSTDGIFRYSTEDPNERRAAYAAIMAMPSYGSGREREFQPGYYEVAVAEKDGSLLPLFFDYRDEPCFRGER
jgi:hypothetical protein